MSPDPRPPVVASWAAALAAVRVVVETPVPEPALAAVRLGRLRPR